MYNSHQHRFIFAPEFHKENICPLFKLCNSGSKSLTMETRKYHSSLSSCFWNVHKKLIENNDSRKCKTNGNC